MVRCLWCNKMITSWGHMTPVFGPEPSVYSENCGCGWAFRYSSAGERAVQVPGRKGILPVYESYLICGPKEAT